METSFRLWTAEASRPRARLASSRLSTFPQPCSSTASQRLSSLFAGSIHRPVHRALALHTRGWRDRSALSCWPWALMQRSTCPPSLPSRLPSGQQPSAHARLSDEVSDNRHGQRWTSADIHGRPVAGHACCGAGSPRLLGFGTKRPTPVESVLAGVWLPSRAEILVHRLAQQGCTATGTPTADMHGRR